MTYSAKKVKLIQELSNAPGAPGFEDAVLVVVRSALEDICTFEEDKIRNLYIYRKNHTGEKPVLMLDAHGDECGFMVHSIKPNGTLRFVGLGSMDTSSLAASELLVRNVDGDYVRGIVGLRTPSYFNGSTSATPPRLQDFTIDIGASSAAEAVEKFGIGIGEPAVPATICNFDEKHGLFYGKAFDCRIGVAVLIETLRRLDGLDLPFDVIGVISSQEEVGSRGMRVAVDKVKPDIAICFEGCPADDTYVESYAIQNALKHGPAIRYMDGSVICSPRFQRWVLQKAKEHNIPIQASVREGGGNNGSVISQTNGGVPVVVAGVPARYVHAAAGITAYEDFEHTAALGAILAKELTPDILSTF